MSGEEREAKGDTGELRFVRPSGWMRPSGYSDAIVAPAGGRTIFIAGQIGWNPASQTFETTDFVGQVRRTLQNVLAVLRAAGAEPRHLVRLTWFVVDRDEYMTARRQVGEVYREVIGMHYPAMSLLVVSGLLEEGAKVEIEATAVVPGSVRGLAPGAGGQG